MRPHSRVALAGLICAAAAPALQGTAGAAVPHTVQPGETLWSVAAANNLTTRTVAAFNGIGEETQLIAGQTIQVPTVDEGAAALAAAPAPATEPASGGSGGHVVAAGETLSAIAAANGLSTEALAAANGRDAGSFVYEGETLSIPAATTAGVVPAAVSGTEGLGHVPSPWGELHLDPAAADAWNAMRGHSLGSYGQDLYPGGPLSAYRTYEQQAQLYSDYLNGAGPLAAPPGTSAHEYGLAVDVPAPEMRSVIDQIGAAYGWGKTEAPGEWWHLNYYGGG